MVKKTKTATATTAYGKTLATPLEYTFEWDEYENPQAARSANDWLNDDDVLKVINDARQNKARQQKYLAKLDEAGIKKPTAENDEQVRLRDMLKTLMTAKNPDGTQKYTEDAAKALASQVIGVEWAE